MTKVEEKFVFLTSEEFNRLSRTQKVVYLEQAIAQRGGRIENLDQSLFLDSPPTKANAD
jgi:hypothetical protein